MNAFWQNVVVLAAVALCALLLAARVWRVLGRKRCGGCGSCSSEAGKTEQIVTLQPPRNS
jgi:hypothetical protein